MDILSVWFDDFPAPFLPVASEEREIVSSLARVILHQENQQIFLETIRDNRQPRIVFLSVSDSQTKARVFLGTGRGIAQAIAQIFSKLQPLLETGYQPQWLKFDIVIDVIYLEGINWQKPLKLDRSMYGLAFDRESGIAFLPEELVAYTLVNEKQYIRPKNISKYIQEKPDFLDFINFKMYQFTSNSWFSDGRDTSRLYRGHCLFDNPTKSELLSAASQGGNYLVNAVNSDGKFVYIYRPKTDEVPKQYNILRHAGTIYSMLELYEVTEDKELIESVEVALNYLFQSFQYQDTDLGMSTIVVERGIVKLGGNALAAIALAKYIEITEDREHLPIILQLGKAIQGAQNETGEFEVQKQSYPEGEIIKFISEYYPGEAILALTRIYALNPDESWLDSAEAAALYLINVRDRDLSDSQLLHDHWLLYGLNELYRYRQNPVYLNHALRMARAIAQSQNRQPDYADWRGSFYKPPRSTPTATRMEGLCAAYQLARDFGEAEDVRIIKEAIALGISFQLQTQFRPESVLYVKNPQRCLGGFHRSLSNLEIRIDYVQHNISSLLGWYRITGENYRIEEASFGHKS